MQRVMALSLNGFIIIFISFNLLRVVYIIQSFKRCDRAGNTYFALNLCVSTKFNIIILYDIYEQYIIFYQRVSATSLARVHARESCHSAAVFTAVAKNGSRIMIVG